MLYVFNRVVLRGKPLPGWRAKWRGQIQCDAAALRAAQPAAQRPIVMHGVSLGEVQLMRLIIPRIEHHWQRSVVLSTSSATGMQALGEQFPDQATCWLPFDRPAAVRRWLRSLQPRALILLELEIWPQLLLECRRQGIPVIILNARCSAGSYTGYRRLQPLLRPAFTAITGGTGAKRPVGRQVTSPWGARCSSRRVIESDLVQPVAETAVAALRQRCGLSSEHQVLLLAVPAWMRSSPLCELGTSYRSNFRLGEWSLSRVTRNAGQPSPNKLYLSV